MGLFTRKPEAATDFHLFISNVAPKWPDESFEKGETMKNQSGQNVTGYTANLPKKYFYCFDVVEIRDFEGIPNKNILFQPKQVKIKEIKMLVNDFAKICGVDHIGQGKFTSEDELEIKKGYWSGRSWTENQKHPVMIHWAAEDDEYGKAGLSMSIHYCGE